MGFDFIVTSLLQQGYFILLRALVSDCGFFYDSFLSFLKCHRSKIESKKIFVFLFFLF